MSNPYHNDHNERSFLGHQFCIYHKRHSDTAPSVSVQEELMKKIGVNKILTDLSTVRILRIIGVEFQ